MTSDPYYHFGHLLLESLKERPDDICQIDAATGEQETNLSVLKRTIRLVRYLRRLRLRPGAVAALGGANHLDIHVPLYAALLTGMPVAALDPTYKFDEMKASFKLTKPKILFIDHYMYEDASRAIQELGLDTRIITFDEGECTLKDVLDSEEDEDVDTFQPEKFEADKVFLWLMSTSGTTGVLKYAAFDHLSILKIVLIYKNNSITKTGKPPVILNLSPAHWISGFFKAVTPVHGAIKLQTSAVPTVDHIIDIINKYKPTTTMISPSLASQILKSGTPCDLSCFQHVTLTGSKVRPELLTAFRARVCNGVVAEAYGQTETIGGCLKLEPEGPLGNCGSPSPLHQVKLVDPDTEEEITEPNKPGEMWVKGPRFVEYYNMPEETAKVFSKDGYIKTGDLLYRDENNYFYYVERIKMLIKYKNYHVVPLELEAVIQKVAGVEAAAVTSVADPECGELPAAVVVRAPGADVTAQQVKDAVANELSDSKRLRGGVVFVDALPYTSTGKVARAKLRELVKTGHRE
ncbi:4-coumarate--CoA ligase 1 isoform X2 [Plutella xylostella]|uniref:4-coumarate--CoA ligase 1 isoform X2 n=1 Tax=Plutella xylostella TaxID=51655 RepID=UPI00203240E5|nr:4-coumarate--CoA ligase 1 isoform X2 [Plutella xylostella]